MPTALDIVTSARAWLDTPYGHQGRLKGVSCDCLGLLVGVCVEHGLTTYDTADYSEQPNGDFLRATADAICTPTDKIEPGVVLLFRIRTNPQHFAIATPIGMIHAHEGAGKVVEHELDDKWRDRIVGIYKLPGVVYG